MSEEITTTPFSIIYDDFFTRVTDDMYMQWTELDTMKDLQSILITAIPRFEFPRFNIFDYTLGHSEIIEKDDPEDADEPSIEWIGGYFNSQLSREEINILSVCMMIEWFNRQIATVENTRMKFTGSDFKMSSQANHLAKLNTLRETYLNDSKHLQRLYKRRMVSADGQIRSTAGQIVTTPTYGYNI